jgi:hypothetical protein
MSARFIIVIVILIAFPAAVDTAAGKAHDEAALKQAYDAFVESLDHRSLAKDYPKAVQNLDSTDPKIQVAGIQTLAGNGSVEAIPWIVPLLDSNSHHVRLYASLGVYAIVASYETNRRDKRHPERVVILPPGPGDVDLKPMAWVIVKLLRHSDDGNISAHAARMIGLLGLREFETDLRQLLKSRHPAVTRAARWALDMLGTSQNGDEADFDDLVEQLQKLGLRITANQTKIGAATSEAAYFMFADRKEHRPECKPFTLPDEGQWLERKPVFTNKADKEKIHPLFRKLVEQMGYNEVRIYDADVHYGVSNYANFTLYKLGYVKDNERRGKRPEVLLGDADYVINLP